MMPFLSVGVITYNHEKYIAQCLEGILMQETSFPFRIIIGEDCSSDNTRAIVERYEAKYPHIIKPIYHGENVGGARNAYEFVFPKLLGRYIAMCEGDDFWTDPHKLQKQVSYLEANNDASFCFHSVHFINSEGKRIGSQPETGVIKYTPGEIFHIKIPTLSVVMRNCIEEVPPEIFTVKSSDAFLFGLLARYGGAADLGFLGGSYRKHAGGAYTGMPTIEQHLQTLNTLKVMRDSSLFSEELKKEISQELRARKKRYLKHFLRRNEMLNSLKIVFS